MLSIDDKARIIMEKIKESTKNKKWNPENEESFLRGIILGLEEIEDREPTRTLPQIRQIVECVRAGIPVLVDYADGAPDDMVDKYVERQCW